MFTLNTLVFSLTIFLFVSIKFSDATISCTSCPMVIYLNITSDTDINTQGCGLVDSTVCSLTLRVDYMDTNESFALFQGSNTPMLILTNGEPQVSETIFIWFNELRVQRMASVICFASSSCGLDLVKQLYKDKFRSFDYSTIQNKLIDELYSSTAPSANLTCADPSGASVSCSDGFCRSVLDGNGFVTYSSCVKKGSVTPSYGLTLTKVKLGDFGDEQISVMYACNTPMCNSKENSHQVLQNLANAQLIPQIVTTTSVGSSTTTPVTGSTTTSVTGSTTTSVTGSTTTSVTNSTTTPAGSSTTTPVTGSTTTTSASNSTTTPSVSSTTASAVTSTTTGHSAGIKIMSNKQILIVLSLFLFSLI